MTNEMIERVARAICESDSPDNNWNDKSMSEYTKNAWRFYAKAAIEAMREPSEGMTNPFIRVGHGVYGDVEAKAVWQEMIDEALRE